MGRRLPTETESEGKACTGLRMHTLAGCWLALLHEYPSTARRDYRVVFTGRGGFVACHGTPARRRRTPRLAICRNCGTASAISQIDRAFPADHFQNAGSNIRRLKEPILSPMVGPRWPDEQGRPIPTYPCPRCGLEVASRFCGFRVENLRHAALVPFKAERQPLRGSADTRSSIHITRVAGRPECPAAPPSLFAECQCDHR